MDPVFLYSYKQGQKHGRISLEEVEKLLDKDIYIDMCTISIDDDNASLEYDSNFAYDVEEEEFEEDEEMEEEAEVEDDGWDDAWEDGNE